MLPAFTQDIDNIGRATAQTHQHEFWDDSRDLAACSGGPSMATAARYRCCNKVHCPATLP